MAKLIVYQDSPRSLVGSTGVTAAPAGVLSFDDVAVHRRAITGSGGSTGTVVAEEEQGVHADACQVRGLLLGPAVVPVWGSCSDPECWRLVVQDSSGEFFRPCVGRDEFDRTQLGAFWRERTDW